MMSGSLNLSSQQLSFVNKISLIHKATSDDETITPTYLFKEINDISFESIGYCESLVEFLVDRLKSKSCHVKLKVLKVMKHVLEHGSKEFQLGLRAHADAVKECAKFSGAPHPLHGNVPYVMVRNLAKELCETLYNLDPLNLKRPSLTNLQAHKADPKYGGLGPSRTGGAIQGFGNVSPQLQKGFGETLIEGIEKLGSRISETPADRQAAVLARLNLSGSSSNYQPPLISQSPEQSPLSPPQSSRLQSAKPLETSYSQPIARKSVIRHSPGKAGGGWNDDDDDDGGEDDSLPDKLNLEGSGRISSRSIETDSLTDKCQTEEMQADWCQEIAVVDEFIQQNSGRPGKGRMPFLPFSSVQCFVSKCSSVNCDNIVKLLSQKLSSQNAVVVARSLQALEGLINNKDELINIDLLAAICKSHLQDCFHHCESQLTQGGNEDDGETKVLWKQVQMKSAKIILILHQLSSQKEILKLTEISRLFPVHQVKQEA